MTRRTISSSRIRTRRLDRQLISRHRFDRAKDVVKWFGAMQAQEYLAAQWALGLRTRDATETTIEKALTRGSVIRIHLFRGTWQYVAREDVRWMLGLVGARVIASGASRFRDLGLDDRTLKRCGDLFARALAGGKHLTRKEMGNVLEGGGITTGTERLSHILGYAELDGVICSGRRRGKQRTYALIDERVSQTRSRTREEALSELAIRYFQSRGPATVRDFSWWTGLTLRDARESVELAKSKLVSMQIDDETHWLVDEKISSRRSQRAYLLPEFDEYLVAYKDRSALIDAAHVRKVNAGGGILKPAVVIDGAVVGTWTRKLENDVVVITVRPFARLARRQRDAIAEAAERYSEFVGRTAQISI